MSNTWFGSNKYDSWNKEFSIIIIINFIYVSGYLAYKLIGETTKPNTEIKCLSL